MVLEASKERLEAAALIRRMAGGDQSACSDFYDRYAGLVTGLLRRLLGQEADVEDVLQEVFWQSWVDAGKYDARRGSPEAWLLNRARSRAIDRLRSIRRRSETIVASLEEGGEPEAGTLGRNRGEMGEDRSSVRTALALLPESQRQVIELAYLGGFTQSEIAVRLGEPLGTVKTRIRLGMERLRAHFRGGDRGAS
jgi:RNA polymerase sigma-70 factor (ECF subfamily)